jgi:hypothetical protein
MRCGIVSIAPMQLAKRAGHKIPIGRGVWVSLYIPEGNDPVSHVGAGAGLKTPPIATIPLKDDAPPAVEEAAGVENNFETLSITEAKRRLATTLGVKPENIKITVDA